MTDKIDRNIIALMRDEAMSIAAKSALSSEHHAERLLAAMVLEQLDRRTSPEWAGTRAPDPVNDRLTQLEATARELCNIADANIFTPTMSATAAGGVGGAGVAAGAGGFVAINGSTCGGTFVANPTAEHTFVVGATTARVGAGGMGVAAAPNTGLGGGGTFLLDTSATNRVKERVAELRRLVEVESPAGYIELAQTRRPGTWFRLVAHDNVKHVQLESISDIAHARDEAWTHECDLPSHQYSSNVQHSGWSALLDQVIAVYMGRR